MFPISACDHGWADAILGKQYVIDTIISVLTRSTFIKNITFASFCLVPNRGGNFENRINEIEPRLERLHFCAVFSSLRYSLVDH